ncbi:MAG: DUF3179 domain-containing protein [Wenzhouxiangellaceae bacterium]
MRALRVLQSFWQRRTPGYALARIAVLGLVAWLLIEWLVRAPAPSNDLQQDWPLTDFDRSLVPVEEFEPGGPPKDGIPAIDKPHFVDINHARRWLEEDAPVIAVRIDKEARAYPIAILIWHEIVNDQIGDTPIAVTFCPLCNAALVFDRRVENRALDFGTTGWLRSNDLIMYDRQTESWWQQLTGKALVGAMAGERLNELPAQVIALGDFAAAYPDGRVLSRKTGYWREYGKNPYLGYDSMTSNPLAAPAPGDERLAPMTRVLAVNLPGARKIYPLRAVKEQGLINDMIGDVPVVIMNGRALRSPLDHAEISRSRKVPAATAFCREVDGQVLDFQPIDKAFEDLQTGSRWNIFGQAISGPLQGQQLKALPGGVHFAFAWLAFHPHSGIYQAEPDPASDD